MNDQKISIYEEITAKIITALEDGVNPWAKPWQTVHWVFRRKRSVELPRKRPLFRCESGHHSGEKGQCQERVSGLVFLYCHSFGFLVKH